MKIFLIDTMNLFHRAFWGNEPLHTSYGMPVQGLYGFTKSVFMLLDQHKPDMIVFAMESKTKNIRKTLSPVYKANRQEPNEDLKVQLKMLPELLDGFGYPIVSADGYEGDDVIATLAEKYKASNDIYIISGDKDFNQLVGGNVKIYDPAKDLVMDSSAVYLKYGITPEQFVDYLAIVGDTSDNVKGVDGVGPKGAVKLLTEFNTLENIYANISVISGKTKEKLLASLEQVKLAKILVKMTSDLDLSIPLVKAESTDQLKNVLKKLEFQSFYDRVELNSTSVQVGSVNWD